MPSLNIKGNVLEDFGTQLPNVVIDSVNVNDASMDVLVSLYFNFEEDITPTELNQYIYKLGLLARRINVYVGYILGERFIKALVNKENTDIWSEFYNPNSTGAGRFSTALGTHNFLVHVQDERPNYIQLAFNTSNFSPSDQNFYDDDDNRIFQYSATINLPISFGLYSYSETSTNPDHTFENVWDLSETNSIFSGPLSPQLQDMNVVAFTSWIDLNTPDPNSTIEVQDIEYGHLELDLSGILDKIRAFNYTTPDLMPLVKRQMTSDISYVPVFTNGNIDSGIRIAYMDSAGGSYNNTPIQAINGKFYKQDAYSLEQISALFSSYVSTVIVEDEEVQSVLDNITYVVETFGESSQLLLELNILRKAFPEKSSATAVGRLYEGFKSRFFGANEKVAAGTPVVEKLYKSSKIRDIRVSIPSTSVSAEDQTPSEQNFIYMNRSGHLQYRASARIDWSYGDWMSAVQVYREGNYGQPEVYQYLNTGFWFFDYQLALKQYASILSIFTLEKVNKIFGQGAIHKYFNVDKVVLEKRQYIGEDTTDMVMGHIDDTALLMTMTLDVSHGFHADRLSGEVLTTTFSNNYQNSLFPPAEDNCWMMIRGIQGLDIDDDHKLMCFQYQDIENSYDGDYDNLYDKTDERKFYTPSVLLYDNTAELLKTLPDSFDSYFNGEFEQYYLTATENCSYSITDGAFNDFFKNGIMANYGEDPENHPWIVMPLLLNLHRDLLAGEFGGDDEKIKENANAVAVQINPINGTLPALEAFKDRCETFRTNYYGEGSHIDNIITAAASSGEYFWIGSPHHYIFAKPPTPISVVESEWEWTNQECPPGKHWSDSAGACVDDEVSTYTTTAWVQDSAYVGFRYDYNYAGYWGDDWNLKKKILKKWNFVPDYIAAYDDATGGPDGEDARLAAMAAIDNWLANNNPDIGEVITMAQNWAELYDTQGNNADDPAVEKCTDYVYDSNAANPYGHSSGAARYKACVAVVHDDDSYDTIKVYREDWTQTEHTL